MALRNSVSAAACVMVGLALVGNVLKGQPDGGGTDLRTVGATAAVDTAPSAPSPKSSPSPITFAAAGPVPAATGPVDDMPTGSIDPGSGLHRPNPAAYGDAAKPGSSLVLTGAEAVNYLAGNTLRRGGSGGEPLHFTYFASRGVTVDGSERDFVARAWDRNRSDLCEAGRDGAQTCLPIQILLDAKQELQGGRLGTVTIGGATAELIKGNVLRVPQHIPFIDSTVALDGSAAPDAAKAGPAGLLDHTAAVTTDAGMGRHFVFYGADNRLLDIQPIEAGPGGGHAVRVAVGHWRLSKATLCETADAAGAAQTCFKTENLGDGAMRLVPVTKGGQTLRAVVLTEARARPVAED